MKVQELQYKMKSSRPIKDMNDFNKLKVAKKAMNHNNQQFLQSAQDFYLKNSFKREPQTSRTHNLQMNIKHQHREESFTPVQKSTDASKSRITPEAFKRSVERDYNNNLEHWRRETFKYQEQVFILQRKNSELMAENSNLKYELRLRQEEQNKLKLNVHSEKEIIPSQRIILQRNIRQMEAQLRTKGKRIAELEIIVNVLTKKIQKLSVFPYNPSMQAHKKQEKFDLQIRIDDSLFQQLKKKQEMSSKHKTLSSQCPTLHLFWSQASAKGANLHNQ